MFTTILGSLTSLLPRSFIFGSYIPVLIVGFVNASLLYWSSPSFRETANAGFASGPLLATAVLFTLSVIAAYMMSAVQSVLREVLEGRYLPHWLAASFRTRQQRRLRRLDEDLNVAGNDRLFIGNRARAWRIGLHDRGSSVPEKPRASSGYRTFLPNTHSAIQRLERLRRSWKPVHFEELQHAEALAEEALLLYDVRTDGDLKRDSEALYDVIAYAPGAAETRELELFARRQTEFGVVPLPTRLGNVAASLESYAASRYGIDIDTFWSRLQPIIQRNDEKAYGALVDAKTQLDFLITCCWGVMSTAIGWSVLFAALGVAPLAAILTLPAGLAISWIFYRLSVTAYISYTEFVRACVDLNRFALLKALHIALPAGIRDERALWKGLQRVSSFGSGAVELSYQHDPP
ncbi:MAG TPA: hypothetical protein VN224_04760 [Xanthomonadales bacterium]|nr:hypothetical protein [Xanthomonadales bacterium]